MKNFAVSLTNNSGCCFDSATFASAKSAVNFCKGRGGDYSADFYGSFADPITEYSVRVSNYNGKTTFSEVRYDRRTGKHVCKRISAAALTEKLNSL